MSYKDIVIPKDKDVKKYNAAERRHVLLQIICEKGHPSMINQTEIAKDFDVTQGMISKDIEAIRKDVTKHLGTDADLIMESVMTKSITQLQNKGKYFEAARVAEMLGKWFFNRGVIEKTADKVEVTGSDITVERLHIAYEASIKESKAKQRLKKDK